jgi:hypothetical protein
MMFEVASNISRLLNDTMTPVVLSLDQQLNCFIRFIIKKLVFYLNEYVSITRRYEGVAFAILRTCFRRLDCLKFGSKKVRVKKLAVVES